MAPVHFQYEPLSYGMSFLYHCAFLFKTRLKAFFKGNLIFRQFVSIGKCKLMFKQIIIDISFYLPVLMTKSSHNAVISC